MTTEQVKEIVEVVEKNCKDKDGNIGEGEACSVLKILAGKLLPWHSVKIKPERT